MLVELNPDIVIPLPKPPSEVDRLRARIDDLVANVGDDFPTEHGCPRFAGQRDRHDAGRQRNDAIDLECAAYRGPARRPIHQRDHRFTDRNAQLLKRKKQ